LAHHEHPQPLRGADLGLGLVAHHVVLALVAGDGLLSAGGGDLRHGGGPAAGAAGVLVAVADAQHAPQALAHLLHVHDHVLLLRRHEHGHGAGRHVHDHRGGLLAVADLRAGLRALVHLRQLARATLGRHLVGDDAFETVGLRDGGDAHGARDDHGCGKDEAAPIDHSNLHGPRCYPARRMRRTAAALVVLLAAPVAADEPAPPPARRSHFEAWVGGSWTDPLLDTTYQTRYSPTFDFERPAETTAGQTLTVHGDGTIGGEIGIGWSPDGRWHFRLTADRASSSLSGVNTPYAWTAKFVALPPPSNEPQTIEVEQSLDWPDTEGELRVTTFALGVSHR